ncbi:MAG TPA: glycosyltransferase [Hyphomicrobiaceae bacterium]|nr:glycosyltransferase [Hyphomicrobiaceae bacterium]
MSPIGTTIASSVWPGVVAFGLVIAALPWLRRESTVARTVVLGFAILLTWRYVAWRVSETLPPAGLTADWIAGLAFAGVEALALVSTTITLLFMTRTRNRSADVEANMAWLLDRPRMPRIDVLICTYNEEEPILEQTIVGAMAMHYPNFRVWVCDDGRRRWLKELCERHGCGYIARNDNAHAKAGNINNALSRLEALPDPPEFISILDADFVPTPEFLTRAMTLFRDERVAIVQTPQHFVNPDPIQGNLSAARVWPDEQRYFFDVLMASMDAWGAAFCCGTSSVIRFSALKRIGGFPTESVTEDYLVTLRLRQIGYQTVYLNERLTLGLAPEGLKEYITQRSRWCLGFVQICRGRCSPIRPGNGLSLVDRLILSGTFLYWSAAHLFRLLGLLIPALYLLFGVEAVHADVSDAILNFVPYFVVQCAIMAWLSEGRLLPIMADVSQLLCAHSVVRAVAAGLVKPKGQKFKVTAKGGDRDKLFVQWSLFRIFAFYLALTIAGVMLAFVIDDGRPLQESSVLALFWSWYNIIILTIACMVCIEQPRKRKAERFATCEPVTIIRGGQVYAYPLLDISTGGMRLAGKAPATVGTEVAVKVGDTRVMAQIVRADEGEFALRTDHSLATRKAMIRHVYGGRYSAAVERIRAGQVMVTILGRVFR